MPKLTGLYDFIDNKHHVTDLHNPKCKNCNECCGLLTMLTEEEFQYLKEYLTHTSKGRRIYQHGIDIVLAHYERGTIYFACPFSNENKRCEIYSLRPSVCRNFHCSPEINKVVQEDLPKTHSRYLWELFYTNKGFHPIRMILD